MTTFLLGRKTRTLAAAALALALITPAQAASTCKVTDPTGTPMNVRSEPNSTSRIVRTLKNGTTVIIGQLSEDGRWVENLPPLTAFIPAQEKGLIQDQPGAIAPSQPTPSPLRTLFPSSTPGINLSRITLVHRHRWRLRCDKFPKHIYHSIVQYAVRCSGLRRTWQRQPWCGAPSWRSPPHHADLPCDLAGDIGAALAG
jgi:hypothetical protein